MLESQTKNDYYNEAKEENETGGYYAFSVGSQLPKDAIEVKIFYEYVEKRRGKDGYILKEFLVSILQNVLIQKSALHARYLSSIIFISFLYP